MKGDDYIVTKAQIRASKKYSNKTYSRFTINLRKVEDSEIISKLEQEPSKTEAVRKALEEYYKNK